MLTLWCLFGSPLMIGGELTKMDDRRMKLLTNREVLAMLTPECKPWQICRDDEKAIWRAANEKTGQKYFALFNLNEEEKVLSVELQAAGMDEGCKLTELWTGAAAEGSGGKLQITIPAHGCAVFGGVSSVTKGDTLS